MDCLSRSGVDAAVQAAFGCHQAAAGQPVRAEQAAAASAEGAAAYGDSSSASHGGLHTVEAATNRQLRSQAVPLLGGLATALAAADPDVSPETPAAGKSVDSPNLVESRRHQQRRRAGRQPGDVQLGKRPADESVRSSHSEGHEQAKKRRYSKAAQVSGQATAAPMGSGPVTRQTSSLPPGQHAIRHPVSMSQHSAVPSETISQPVGRRGVEALSTPQHIAILDHMCSQPSASPGDEPVLPVMGILVFTALMQDTGLMRADQLSLFNKELVCQNALIAENFSDVVSVCLKLEALAALGRESFRLSEIFPGEQIEDHLAQTRFMVPIGRLSAGKALHEAQLLDGAARGSLIQRIWQGIMNSRKRRLVHAELKIAYVGQGSNGHDGSVILVEEATPNRAWVVNVQSRLPLLQNLWHNSIVEWRAALGEYALSQCCLIGYCRCLAGIFPLPSPHAWPPLAATTGCKGVKSGDGVERMICAGSRSKRTRDQGGLAV